jgi:hypothetical protein
MDEDKKMSDGISSKVWQKIADKHLKPLPRWRFIFKEVILWCLLLIFLVVASISVAFIMIEFFNADWDLHGRLAGSLVDYVIMIFPYFWLICLSVVIVLAYYNFSLTRRGYKYGLLWIFLGSVFLSILLGGVMYFTNLGQYLDEIAEHYLPTQKMIINKQHEMWSHPEKGLLGGRVVFVALPRFFELKAFNNEHWLIVISDYRAPRFFIKEGELVKIIGRKLNNNTFESHEIRPWRSHDCPCCVEKGNGSCLLEGVK